MTGHNQKESSPVTLGEGKFLRLVNRKSWEYVERIVGSGVVIIVAEYEGNLILTEQFRPSVQRMVIDLPAGLAGDQGEESFVEAAKRELLEETGFRCEKVTFLTEGPSSSGLSNEIISFFKAEALTRVGKGGGDATEQILVHEVPIKEIEEWAKQQQERGALVDPKVFTGIYFCRTRA